MGLFDNLFKTKPDPADEAVVEAAKRIAETEKARLQEAAKAPTTKPASRTGAVSTTKPGAVPPPRAYSPRTLGQVVTPARGPGQGKAGETVKGSGIRRIKLSAAEAAAKPTEIVLLLEDVLPRIPMELLSDRSADLKRELHFKVEDLSADIARGRAAVALGRIAAQVPEIFREPISSDDARQIRLPLQKLVEQIGFLPAKPVSSPGSPSAATAAPGAQITPPFPPRPAPAPATPPPIIRPPSTVEKPPKEIPAPAVAAAAPSSPELSVPPSVRSTPAAPEHSGTQALRISLRLTAVLRCCPRDLIVAELPPIGDEEQISFAWAPIEKQLETGEVEISSVRFIFALPAHLQGYFEAREGVRVPLPLDEIRRHLPRGASIPARKPEVVPGVFEVPTEVPPSEEEPAAELPAAAPEPQPEPSVPAEPIEIPAEIFARRPSKPEPPAAEPRIEAPEPPQEPPVTAPAEVEEIPFALFQRKPAAAVPAEATPAESRSPEPALAEQVRAEEAVPSEAASVTADAPVAEPTAEAPIESPATEPEPAVPTMDVEVEVEIVPPAAPASEPEPEPAAVEAPISEAPAVSAEPEVPAPAPEGVLPSAEAVLELAPPVNVHLPPPIQGFGAVGVPPLVPPVEREEMPEPAIASPSVETPGVPAATESTEAAQPSEQPEAAPVFPLTPPIFVPPPLRQAGESLAPETAPVPLEPAASAGVHSTPLPPNVWMQPPPEVTSRPAAPWPPDVAPPPSPILPVRVVAPPVLRPLVAPPPLFGSGAEERGATPVVEAKPVEAPAPPPPPPPLELGLVRTALGLPEDAGLVDVGRELIRLPGMSACLLSARHETAHAGDLGDSFDPVAALALARQLSAAVDGSAEKLGAGRVQHLTIFAESHCVSFFTQGNAVVCAIHRTRAFLPGVREKLSAAAAALAEA